MCADLGDYRPAGTAVVGDTAQCTLTQRSKWTDTYDTIRYDTIEEINVDSKAEYTA